MGKASRCNALETKNPRSFHVGHRLRILPNKPLSGIFASAGTSSAWASDCGVHIHREPLEHQLLRDTLLLFRPGYGRQIVKLSESLTSF